MYEVVQIWPGQTVTCLHTISPGHIWTTLYKNLQIGKTQLYNSYLLVNPHKLRPRHGIGTNGSCVQYCKESIGFLGEVFSAYNFLFFYFVFIHFHNYKCKRVLCSREWCKVWIVRSWLLCSGRRKLTACRSHLSNSYWDVKVWWQVLEWQWSAHTKEYWVQILSA
jgi:hypothetical protein